MGIAPKAVKPGSQRQRVRSLLVASGLRLLEQHEHPFVIVLDHPDYYPRFVLGLPPGMNSPVSGRACRTKRSWC